MATRPMRSPTVKYDPHYSPHGHLDGQDAYIDMQYADASKSKERGVPLDPIEFATNPWEYYKDPAITYLSLRADKRDRFEEELLAKDEECEVDWNAISRDIGRIEQTRVNFQSFPGKEKVIQELVDARKEWREEVLANRLEYVEQVKKRRDKPGWKRNHEVDLALLDRIEKWDLSDPLMTSKMKKKIDPYHGSKAAAMYFKKSSDNDGWEGETYEHPSLKLLNPDVKFPNQKIPMGEFLQHSEDKKDNLLSEDCPGDRLRYFHLGSNNMHWIEEAMARYYHEETSSNSEDWATPPDTVSKSGTLLRREFWRGQLHGGRPGKGPVHARHMRSRCSLVPLDSESGAFRKGNNLAIFMPYLHWETNSRRAKMAAVIKEEVVKRREEEEGKKPKKSVYDVLDARKEQTMAKTTQKSSEKKKCRENLKEETKTEKLGPYLLALARVYDEMDYAADEQLLRDNLHRDPPLHIRRTLDQAYFLTLEDTGNRDKDQVVYRGTREGRSFHTRNTRVVMCDQLWLWILDDNTIITSFPRRWGRNKPDPSGVHKSLRDRLAHTPKGEIKSVYDLAIIIIDQCSRVFFDLTKPIDERPEVMDLFGSAIGNLMEQTTRAYETFWAHYIYITKPANSSEIAGRNYLGIRLEGTLLLEAQDIAEELQIMLRIYKQQVQVVRDLRKILGHRNGESKNEPDDVKRLVKLLGEWEKRHLGDADNRDRQKSIGSDAIPEEIPGETIEAVNDILELIRNRQREIEELEAGAQRITTQIQGLLSLKQQQSSIVEAQAALRRANESVKQGRAIMAFTLVTIFFLPLGFFAGFFGMSNLEISGDAWMTLGEQVKWMFGLSAAVIVLSVSMAFSTPTRTTTLTYNVWLNFLVRVPGAFILEYTRLHQLWKYYVSLFAELEKKSEKQIEEIYKRKQRQEAEEKKRKDEILAIGIGETPQQKKWFQRVFRRGHNSGNQRDDLEMVARDDGQASGFSSNGKEHENGH